MECFFTLQIITATRFLLQYFKIYRVCFLSGKSFNSFQRPKCLRGFISRFLSGIYRMPYFCLIHMGIRKSWRQTKLPKFCLHRQAFGKRGGQIGLLQKFVCTNKFKYIYKKTYNVFCGSMQKMFSMNCTCQQKKISNL